MQRKNEVSFPILGVFVTLRFASIRIYFYRFFQLKIILSEMHQTLT